MNKLFALLLVVASSAVAGELPNTAPLSKERIDEMIQHSQLVTCHRGACWDYFTGADVSPVGIDRHYSGQVILFDKPYSQEDQRKAGPAILDHYLKKDRERNQ